MPSAALKLLLVIDGSWCVAGNSHGKLLRTRHSILLSDKHSRIEVASRSVTLKFRNSTGDLVLDDEAHLHVGQTPARVTLHSHKLANELLAKPPGGWVIFAHLEQVSDVLRITIHFDEGHALRQLEEDRPELRFAAFGLPPISVTEIEPPSTNDGMVADSIYEVLLAKLQADDPALFAAHTERFLKAPHIVVPLLSHLASLTAEDNLKFPVQLKRLADQFRAILEMKASPIKLHKIERNHLDAWANAQDKRYVFVDGGVAKIAGLPGTEPTALRVGVYSVCAGDTSPAREEWGLHPFVVGDLIDKNTGVVMEEDDRIDLRRLGEAARYILEPLVALRYAEPSRKVESVFLHGPLINQFVQYDETKPHFIPFLKQEFLAQVGITKARVADLVAEIPRKDGNVMWRQFMAVYGYISRLVFDSPVPFCGVVERSAGSWLAQAVLDGAVDAKIVNAAYKRKVITLLTRYSISDDFLFGCVLAEGEYISPTPIAKNTPHRARDHWKPVVAQYRRPFATVLKTTEVSFPFRVEMNAAGEAKQIELMRLLYHTARLLPRYAFPVGLDIVDKYAKVPDWLSKNISARLASVVLNRAMAEGDERLVAQIRQILAHTPRDFFYRPNVQ